MKTSLKFSQIIENFITEINHINKRSTDIHGSGNIKSAGDEVEDYIRKIISDFLPEKYLVKQGHLINSEGLVSNQLDIIIFDKLSTPKFFETQNNTIYYPIESVLAIGEIKKTLKINDVLEFRDKIKFIKEDMKRELILNPVYNGKFNSNVNISDLVNMKISRRTKNPLFSFIFAIDIKKNTLKFDKNYQYMPNDIYILNNSMILAGYINEGKFVRQIEDEDLLIKNYCHFIKPGAVCLASLFHELINHLNDCHIEPFGISNYIMEKEVFGIPMDHIMNYKSE